MKCVPPSANLVANQRHRLDEYISINSVSGNARERSIATLLHALPNERTRGYTFVCMTAQRDICTIYRDLCFEVYSIFLIDNNLSKNSIRETIKILSHMIED